MGTPLSCAAVLDILGLAPLFANSIVAGSTSLALAPGESRLRGMENGSFGRAEICHLYHGVI